MSASSRLPFTSRERRHGPRRSQREVTLLPSTSPRMQTGAFICNRAVREAALAGHGSINARHSCWRTSSHQHSSQASIQLADLMKGHRKTIFIILTPTTHPDPRWSRFIVGVCGRVSDCLCIVAPPRSWGVLAGRARRERERIAAALCTICQIRACLPICEGYGQLLARLNS